MNPVKNQKGFQLIEVLLSISILSIVLLVFFGFFIQSKTFSAQSQKSSSASQLSQEILQKVRDSNLTSDNAHSVKITTANWTETTNLKSANWEILYSKPIIGEFSIEVDNHTYYPRVQVINAEAYKTIFSLPEPLPAIFDIIIVEIETIKNGNRLQVFETFGYKERD